MSLIVTFKKTDILTMFTSILLFWRLDMGCNVLPVLIGECYRTSYTHGQLWLQYRHNCHLYIVCEPIDDGKYIRHVMTCGKLFWNQEWHACDWTKTGNCTVGRVEEYNGTTENGEYFFWIRFCCCFCCTLALFPTGCPSPNSK